MAKKDSPPPKADKADKVPSPLESAAGRAWLAAHLAEAEREEAHGPGGAGWAYNESHRAAITEHAEFLRALHKGLLAS